MQYEDAMPFQQYTNTSEQRIKVLTGIGQHSNSQQRKTLEVFYTRNNDNAIN